MKSPIKTAAALAALAFGLSVAAAPAFAGSVIVDGNFSNPNVGASWGEFSGTGWTDANEAGGVVEIGHSSIYGLPCDGGACQNLEVNANVFGDVYQTLTGLTPGKSYFINFAYGGRTSGGPQAMNFLVNGTQLGSTISDSIGAWTNYQFNFIAPSSGMAKVEFLSLNEGGSPSYGNEITNVSLAVPEPATWAALILGVAMIGFTVRRRKEESALAV